MAARSCVATTNGPLGLPGRRAQASRTGANHYGKPPRHRGTAAELTSKRSRAARSARRRRGTPGLPLTLRPAAPARTPKTSPDLQSNPAAATHHEPAPSRPVDHLTPRRPPQGRLRRHYVMAAPPLTAEPLREKAS